MTIKNWKLGEGTILNLKVGSKKKKEARKFKYRKEHPFSKMEVVRWYNHICTVYVCAYIKANQLTDLLVSSQKINSVP